MKSLLLVRHGHTIWHDTGGVAGRSDIGLSDHGQRAVAELAQSLPDSLNVDSWYVSPLIRTRHTSEILQNSPSLTSGHPLVVEDQRLVELNFGDWEGMTWQAVHEQYQEAMNVWGEDWVNRSPPNGETFAQQAERCSDWLSNWIDDTEDSDTAMVVLHGGSIRALLCHCLGWPLTRAMNFTVDPASVTSLDFNPLESTWIVRKINSQGF